MIIKSCYIENFGKFNDKTFEFTPSLNVIKEDNGWGKSTLAMFIRSMFYGLQYKRTSKLYERNKYIPWQGGNFGGSLIFEIDSRQYRIERFFGETNTKNDTFKLYNAKLNIESKDYSDKIGEEIFGVDCDSFDKSVFIALDNKKPEISDKITERLNELVSKKKETCNIKDALDKLDKYSTEIAAKRGKGGELNRLKENLDIAKSNIRACKIAGKEGTIIESGILQRKDTLKKHEKDADDLKKQIENTTLYIKKENYNNLIENKNNIDEKLSSLSGFFNNNIPKKNEIDENVERAINLNILKNKLKQYGDINEVYKEIKEYKELFDAETLREAHIDVCEDNINQYNECLRKINEVSLLEDEKNRYKYLNNKYGDCKDSIKKIDTYISKYNDLSNIDISMESKKQNIKLLKDISNNSNNKYKPSNKSFITIGILVLLIGLIMTFVIPPVGIGLLVIGIGFIVGSFVVKGKVKDNSTNQGDYNLEQEKSSLDDLELKRTNIENELDQFIKSIKGNFEKTDTTKILNEIKEDSFNLNNLANKESIYKYTYKKEQLEMSQCKNIVDSFLYKYRKVYPNYKDEKLISLLRSDFQRYNLLSKESSDYEATKTDVSYIATKLDEFLKNCNIEKDLSEIKQMEIIRDNYKEYNKLLDEQISINKKFEDFINNNDINSITALVKPTDNKAYLEDKLLEINKKIQEIRSALTLKEQELIDKNNIFEKVSEYEDEARNLEVNIALLEDKKKIIDATIEYLEIANDNLAEAYMTPMNKCFKKYLLLIDNNNETVKLDSNLSSVIRSGAKTIAGEYYSSGYKDLVTICTKLALFDVIFKKEKPFIIFDDPFVNLDDKKIEKGTQLIKSLAQKHQIIYFTCHDSRAVI